MEQESHCFFSSPVIRQNTHIKRLGLSRKKKICGYECSRSAKIPACVEKYLDSPSQSKNYELGQLTPKMAKHCENEDADLSINYNEEIKLLKVQITEDEQKLKILQCNKNKVEQLENLIEIWKSGSKNVFLHFIQLLKDKESENIDLKTVLIKLGVWETMIENFREDPDILL